MSEIFNGSLARNPANWFIVLIAVVIAAFALHFSLGLIHGMHGNGSPKHPSLIN